MTTTPSFHRFMDAVFGTSWRHTLTPTRIAGIHRRWWRGRFQGMTWTALRAQLRAT